ncbi:MAG: KTSC domain-containing protein [Gammaproteobacteria bacterium]
MHIILGSKAIIIAILYAFFTIPTADAADRVFVKYRGFVDRHHPELFCSYLKPSTFIKDICYAPKTDYLIVKVKHTYYHYCGVPGNVALAWPKAPSLGRYYTYNIRGRYDCRYTGVIPDYG